MNGYGYTLPRYEGEKRVCWRCKQDDSPLFVGERDPQGKPIFDHTVTIELIFIERTFVTPAEKSVGFSFVRVADRNAKYRMGCRDCLDLTEAEHQVWKDFKLQREKDQQLDTDDPFYANLCSE